MPALTKHAFLTGADFLNKKKSCAATQNITTDQADTLLRLLLLLLLLLSGIKHFCLTAELSGSDVAGHAMSGLSWL